MGTRAASESASSTSSSTASAATKPLKPPKKSLVTLAKKGLTYTRVVLAELGPSLPPPGDRAANLVVAVLGLVETAVANRDNLTELLCRALAFLDILAAYPEELPRLRRYREVVGKYTDHLESIKTHAEVYSNRSCLLKLVTVGGDASTFKQLAEGMRDLGEQVMTLVGMDNNARMQEIKVLLLKVAPYQDPSAEARELVEQNGGLDAVVKDKNLLNLVVEKLDIRNRVTIAVICSLLSSGPHQKIAQPDLQLFWFTHFRGESKVPWEELWDKFPSKLEETLQDAALVKQLCTLLEDTGRRDAFQQVLERCNGKTLSAWELSKGFNETSDLLTQICRLLDCEAPMPRPLQHAPSSPKRTAEATQPDDVASVGAAVAWPSQLPPLPPQYIGRGEEAEAVASYLRERGSLVLLAPGGMGKSTLAADVAARLFRAGDATGGALWVDLREAGSAEEVDARFCAALGTKVEKSDNAARILAAIRRLADKSGGGSGLWDMAAVVVVDNAEDAMLQDEAKSTLRGLLREMLTEAPSVRLLLTSRTPLGGGLALEERHVGAISPEAAARLVRATAPDLTINQTKDVAAACRNVPLVLRLVAEALAYGRLVMEDLPKLSAAAAAGCANTDPTSATVRVVLASLGHAQQQAAACLAVFPSAFDVDAAAAVLALTGSQPLVLLRVLCQHGVLQRADGQRYVMHMLVRQQATDLGVQVDGSLRPCAEGRFVRHMLRLLREWAAMYKVPEEWRQALAAARERQADLGRLFELLEGLTPEHGVDVAAVALDLTNKRSVEFLMVLCLVRPMRGPCEALLALLEPGAASAAGQGTEAASGVTGSTPETAAASMLYFLGRYEEADRLYRQALKVAADHVLGPDNPGTYSALVNLGRCLQAQGRYVEAEPLYCQALDLYHRVLGPEHPDTITSIDNLAGCIKARGHYEEVELLYSQALELRKHALGLEHPDTLVIMISLAGSKEDRGLYEEAEALYREAVELRKRILGPEHPDTALAMRKLEACISH